MAEADGVELTEDDLELIAGGKYTYEEWYAMTVEERKAAQRNSIQNAYSALVAISSRIMAWKSSRVAFLAISADTS